MRISDGSSDVCSSDHMPDGGIGFHDSLDLARDFRGAILRSPLWELDDGEHTSLVFLGQEAFRGGAEDAARERGRAGDEQDGEEARSEEHTSELQSLMRTSYAVFCLKKKQK